jgi:hypothetical protein
VADVFWEKMQRVDARIIYVIMMVAIAIPLIGPIGLPMKVMPSTQQVYDVVQKIPDGSTVYLSFDYSPGNGPELDPASQALLTHFFRKNCKVVALSSIAEGIMVARQNLEPWLKAGKVYGKDFINLGYFAGGEVALAQMGTDLKKIMPRDVNGSASDQLEMLKGIQGLKDFALGATVNSGPGGNGTPEVWVRQIAIGYKNVPFIIAPNGTMTASTLPYLQAKQISGVIGGLRPSAEYELLLKKPANGVAAMDAQSAAHVVMITFIGLANIAYFALRKKPGSM